MLVALHVAGWLQGVQMKDASIPLDIVQMTLPWLKARSVSGLFLTVAHIAFAVVFWMLFAAGSLRAGRTHFVEQE